MNSITGYYWGAWIVGLMATMGSLFFSEVMGFVPCSLCWYQRIFMYPVAILLTIGIVKSDAKAIDYTLPLVFLGWLTAFYHKLLMWGIIPESATPCRSGIPCSARYINYFDFITIPFLSLVAFSLLMALIILHRNETYNLAINLLISDPFVEIIKEV